MAFAIDKIKPELLPNAQGLARLGVNNHEGGSKYDYPLSASRGL